MRKMRKKKGIDKIKKGRKERKMERRKIENKVIFKKEIVNEKEGRKNKKIKNDIIRFN